MMTPAAHNRIRQSLADNYVLLGLDLLCEITQHWRERLREKQKLDHAVFEYMGFRYVSPNGIFQKSRHDNILSILLYSPLCQDWFNVTEMSRPVWEDAQSYPENVFQGVKDTTATDS